MQQWQDCISRGSTAECVRRYKPQQLVKGMYSAFLPVSVAATSWVPSFLSARAGKPAAALCTLFAVPLANHMTAEWRPLQRVDHAACDHTVQVNQTLHPTQQHCSSIRASAISACSQDAFCQDAFCQLGNLQL